MSEALKRPVLLLSSHFTKSRLGSTLTRSFMADWFRYVVDEDIGNFGSPFMRGTDKMTSETLCGGLWGA